MAEAKLTVLYPVPDDLAAFDKAYMEEHIPMVEEKIKGMTRMVLDVVHMAPGAEEQPYHRITELYFPDEETIKAALMSPEGMAVAAHATQISTGGPPTILLCESNTRTY